MLNPLIYKATSCFLGEPDSRGTYRSEMSQIPNPEIPWDLAHTPDGIGVDQSHIPSFQRLDLFPCLLLYAPAKDFALFSVDREIPLLLAKSYRAILSMGLS